MIAERPRLFFSFLLTSTPSVLAVEEESCKAWCVHLSSATTSANFNHCTEGWLMLADVVAEEGCTHAALHDVSFPASKKRKISETLS